MLYIYTVFVRVLRFRENGVPVPRWRWATLQPYVGQLVVEDDHVPDLGRHVRIARLIGDEIPRLYDATLVRTLGDDLVLTGFERMNNDLGRVADYAQSWYVRLERSPDGGSS